MTSERIQLFIYIADDLNESCRSMDTEVRRKIDAVRRVRGKVEEGLAHSYEMWSRIVADIEDDPLNPNLPHLREDRDEYKAKLDKYRAESALIVPWLRENDAELFNAASSIQQVKHNFCNCHSGKRIAEMKQEDEDWIRSLDPNATVIRRSKRLRAK